MIIGSSLSSALYAQLRAAGLGRQDGSGVRAADPNADRLAQALEGLSRLQSMPSTAQRTKQAAAEKVAWLKQRLNALKMLLAYASPQDAKALLRELKSIARDLAAVAKSLGSSGGASVQASVSGSDVSVAMSAAQGGAAGASEASGASDAAGSTAAAQEAQPGDGDDAAVESADGQDESSGQAAGADGKPDDSATGALRGDGQDQSLKEALMEARRLFKAVLQMLKSKLGAAGHKQDVRDDLKAAERDFGKFDEGVSHLAGENTYGALANGAWSGLDGGAAGAAAVSGQSVDLKA